ncbi:MAG: CDP-glycerol glycerophosphotransferase family protein [Candidatus Omnitrophota bacterium]|nr:MAG: CDP-glycerol glycerophosphotransferase family protein [Candidatus Omnitrophota bacterium]
MSKIRFLIFLKNRLIRFLKKNASQKKVIIINNYDKTDVLAEAIRHSLAYFGTNTNILCFKSRIPEEFSAFQDKITLSEDYPAYEDYLKIDDYVFNSISKNWDGGVKEKFKDTFIYRGIELARIAEYDLQLFLVPRIKALIVVGRAMKKEDYKAAFIIDCNNEFGNFDKLLQQHYRVPTDYLKIHEKCALQDVIRRRMSSVLSSLTDIIAPLFIPIIQRKKEAKFIDARLFYQLGAKKPDNFLLIPFEKGLKLRLRSLFQNGGYIPFNLVSDVEKKRKNDLKKFDVRNLENRFVFEDMPYWEVVEDKIKTLIYRDFAKFRKNIDILAGAHKRYNIKSIILKNDVKTLAKTMVLSSKRLNIPTLVIQHGILAEPNGHDLILADKVAVWGNRAVRWYKNFGNDSNKMVVTGNHTLNKASHYMDLNENKSFLKQLGIIKKGHVVTFFTTSGGGTSRLSAFENHDISFNLIRDMIKAVRSIGNTNLIIKLHPNESIRTFAKLLNRESRTTMVIKDSIDTRKLMAISDLVVIGGGGSTLGLEAIMMKKPLIVINLYKRQDLVPYVEKNVAIGAYTRDDIERAIKNGLYDDNVKSKMDSARDDFINDFVYKADGKAGERIVKLIENLQ